jgi:site-specific DNA-cytosine methylase
MKIRLGTVFSGIGAIEQALKRMNIEHDIIFACDNGEKTVEEFAWDLYDNLLDGNQLNEMVKLCLI